MKCGCNKISSLHVRRYGMGFQKHDSNDDDLSQFGSGFQTRFIAHILLQLPHVGRDIRCAHYGIVSDIMTLILF